MTAGIRHISERLYSARTPVSVLSVMALAVVLASGCQPRVALTGRVTDTTGQALPGVSVTVEGADAFAVTSGTGVYGALPQRLAVSPGYWKLRFFKTGFTTAEVAVLIAEVVGHSQWWFATTLAAAR